MKKKTSDFSNCSDIDISAIDGVPQRVRKVSDVQNAIDKFKMKCEQRNHQQRNHQQRIHEQRSNGDNQHEDQRNNKSVRRNRKERLKSAHSNQRIKNHDQNSQNVQPNK